MSISPQKLEENNSSESTPRARSKHMSVTEKLKPLEAIEEMETISSTNDIIEDKDGTNKEKSETDNAMQATTEMEITSTKINQETSTNKNAKCLKEVVVVLENVSNKSFLNEKHEKKSIAVKEDENKISSEKEFKEDAVTCEDVNKEEMESRLSQDNPENIQSENIPENENIADSNSKSQDISESGKASQNIIESSQPSQDTVNSNEKVDNINFTQKSQDIIESSQEIILETETFELVDKKQEESELKKLSTENDSVIEIKEKVSRDGQGAVHTLKYSNNDTSFSNEQSFNVTLDMSSIDKALQTPKKESEKTEDLNNSSDKENQLQESPVLNSSRTEVLPKVASKSLPLKPEKPKTADCHITGNKTTLSDTNIDDTLLTKSNDNNLSQVNKEEDSFCEPMEVDEYPSQLLTDVNVEGNVTMDVSVNDEKMSDGNNSFNSQEKEPNLSQETISCNKQNDFKDSVVITSNEKNENKNTKESDGKDGEEEISESKSDTLLDNSKSENKDAKNLPKNGIDFEENKSTLLEEINGNNEGKHSNCKPDELNVEERTNESLVDRKSHKSDEVNADKLDESLEDKRKELDEEEINETTKQSETTLPVIAKILEENEDKGILISTDENETKEKQNLSFENDIIVSTGEDNMKSSDVTEDHSCNELELNRVLSENKINEDISEGKNMKPSDVTEDQSCNEHELKGVPSEDKINQDINEGKNMEPSDVSEDQSEHELKRVLSGDKINQDMNEGKNMKSSFITENQSINENENRKSSESQDFNKVSSNEKEDVIEEEDKEKGIPLNKQQKDQHKTDKSRNDESKNESKEPEGNETLNVNKEDSAKEQNKNSETKKQKYAKNKATVEEKNKTSPRKSTLIETQLDNKVNDLIRKIDNIGVNTDSDSEVDASSVTDYLDNMAEEGEEDTSSEDSNEIVDDGESIGFSSDNEEVLDESYEDSFIDDEESFQLLSGEEEYDLTYKTNKKRKTTSAKAKDVSVKTSRVLKADSSDEEKPKNVRKSKTPEINKKGKTEKWSRIIEADSDVSIEEDQKEQINDPGNVAESTQERESDNEEQQEIISLPKETNEEKGQSEQTNKNLRESSAEPIETIVIADESPVEMINTSNAMITVEELDEVPPSQKKRNKTRSSLSITENLSFEDIRDRIEQVVDLFSSTIKDSGKRVSLNLSLNYDSDSEANEKIESSEENENIDVNLDESYKRKDQSQRKLSKSLENISNRKVNENQYTFNENYKSFNFKAENKEKDTTSLSSSENKLSNRSFKASKSDGLDTSEILCSIKKKKPKTHTGTDIREQKDLIDNIPIIPKKSNKRKPAKNFEVDVVEIDYEVAKKPKLKESPVEKRIKIFPENLEVVPLKKTNKKKTATEIPLTLDNADEKELDIYKSSKKRKGKKKRNVVKLQEEEDNFTLEAEDADYSKNDIPTIKKAKNKKGNETKKHKTKKSIPELQVQEVEDEIPKRSKKNENKETLHDEEIYEIEDEDDISLNRKNKKRKLICLENQTDIETKLMKRPKKNKSKIESSTDSKTKKEFKKTKASSNSESESVEKVKIISNVLLGKMSKNKDSFIPSIHVERKIKGSKKSQESEQRLDEETENEVHSKLPQEKIKKKTKLSKKTVHELGSGESEGNFGNYKFKVSTNDNPQVWTVQDISSPLKPSTTRKIKKLRSECLMETNAKDFKNKMLYDSSRIKRMETELLLKKKKKLRN